jgi:integrase
MERYKPKTVNLRIQAVNKYLDFLGEDKLQLKFIKMQQKNFLENVISSADYKFLKKSLKNDGNIEWYFVVWYLAATGARVSELIQIKVEHVQAGYFDLYTKGGKLRRLYIPKKLRTETLNWLKITNKTFGYIFLNRFGERITTRGISQQLKNYAEKYGLDTKVVYPHSFRHRFAKNFLEKYNDIALLADLMGHESIETTRIYLRKTASEQQALVDKIVTW